MADSPTISSAPPIYPGMNYALLRQAGIEQIAQLAGNLWTDYNTHDPGITILENLCYAITDLSYRLSFEIEDLLAYPADAPLETRQQFFTAREIFTVNPLTINDYRKLLIDIEGVRNAWLEPLGNPEPALYTDAIHSLLSFTTPNLTEPVKLKGLYRVLLEQDPSYPNAQSLIDEAKVRLYPRRNLCEDFAEIKVLALEEITVQAAIEIEEGVNPNALMAQIYHALDRFISPNIDFLSLQDLLAQGIPPETIFEGPALEHGFIDDEQLQQFDRKTVLHTSDLIHVILDIADVKTVRQITIASSQSPEPEAWALDLDPDLAPRLKVIEQVLGNFILYSGQITSTLDIQQVKQALAVLSRANLTSASTVQPLDLPIPTGEHRGLADHEPIQNDFPLNYGMGEIGLPPSASTERKAQAKQLQAYLMVFDQLLANAFAQLDHFKDLFSFHNSDLTTYFTQSIAHHPGAGAVLAENYEQSLETLHEDEPAALERKNRLLNHLMAHYSERLPGDSLLFSAAALSAETIQKKVDFLSDYLTISAGRGRALNTAIAPTPETTDNISGLKRRLSRLLGIPPVGRFLASSQQEGFHIVEHILLRPYSSNDPDEFPGFLSFSKSITEFRPSDVSGQITCYSEQHGLKGGESITLFYSRYYSDDSYTVIPRQLEAAADGIDPNTFDILADYVVEEEGISDTGEWVRYQHSVDPFSFQISVVIPDWPARFQDDNFKQLIYDTLIAETPAHITLYLHWFDLETMRDFESTYVLRLQELSGETIAEIGNRDVTYRLLYLLQLGRSEIPSFPSFLGYTAIGDDFAVN